MVDEPFARFTANPSVFRSMGYGHQIAQIRIARSDTMTAFVVAAIGIVSGLIAIWEFAQYLHDRDRLTWRVVDVAIKKVLKEMDSHDYRPDLVLGVGRGGAIVAGMVAGNLGHVPLAVIDTVLDRSKSMSEVRLRFEDACPDLKDQRVLVVVGELYSGEDLRAAFRFVNDRDPTDVRTMSLFSHPSATTSIRPDYLGRETKKPLDAPWRISEVYRTRRL